MHQLTPRQTDRLRHDAGFTLIELVITVAILGIIVVALAGVVLSYLCTTVDTSARLTESHDVAFAAAYWQRDVASIGVRSTTYDPDESAHSYPLLQSVNVPVPPGCAVPPGTVVATLAWTQYDVAHPDHPSTVTIAYVAAPAGSRWTLTRVRCTGPNVDATVQLADNLTTAPALACPGAAAGCSGTGTDVPKVVTLTLSSNDPNGHDATSYTATLTGERRQS